MNSSGSRAKGPRPNGLNPKASITIGLEVRAYRNSIINVRPVVKTIVGDDGSVTMKATGAIVTLSKESTRVIVKVDVENAKVTEIVTFTETTITKP